MGADTMELGVRRDLLCVERRRKGWRGSSG
jgi:hypothetical protein